MNTQSLFSLAQKRRQRRRNRPIRQQQCLEQLEVRQLLTATLMWDGDALNVTGSENDDFIAIQQDELGLKVFTADEVFTEYEGRSLGTATSVSVMGQGGNDVLFDYQTQVPVSLDGGSGYDFLYSDSSAPELTGGDDFNWVQFGDQPTAAKDSFGIQGFDFDADTFDTTPQFDSDGRIQLEVELSGDADIAGTDVDVEGSGTISTNGVDVSVTGSVAEWDDAFGIDNLNLTDTALTLNFGHDVNEGNGYQVDLVSQMDVAGTLVDIEGSVETNEDLTSASFSGVINQWESAFGVDELTITHGVLTGSGLVESSGNHELNLGIDASLLWEDTAVDVNGNIDLGDDRVEADITGSVANWDNAFGIEGLELQDSELTIHAFSNQNDDFEVSVGLLGDLTIQETKFAVTGDVSIAPDQIDAAFSAAVENWDDVFGIDQLDLKEAAVSVLASKTATEQSLQVSLAGDMDVDGTDVAVNGYLDIAPDSVSGTLEGVVNKEWVDAFGIEGLVLDETQLSIAASHANEESSLSIALAASMALRGTEFDVSGQVQVDDDETKASLSAVVDGTWTDAFGVTQLHLDNTTLSVSASRTSEASSLVIGVAAELDVLGTDIEVQGSVQVNPAGITTDLTGSIAGEWMNAFGMAGLQLRDIDLNIQSDSGNTSTASSGFDIQIDTDLNLFGSYIDVIGDLGISSSGIDLSFSPPNVTSFDNILGIPGFSLDDVDLTVTVGSSGILVAIDSLMDLGNLDVDFSGSIAIDGNEIRADLTGQIPEWSNAFDIPGLNLDDVTLTLGAESGAGGASMFIGLGAAIEIGSSKLDVAGLVGFGATGWEVAFRGSVDSLESDDLVDFANSINSAADPNATTIPDGTLGDLELREAYINFAPKGGNEALGIADGFGIGGAFYNDGKLLGSGEFVVDIANGVFEVDLNVPKLDLGPVEISDVVIDIRLAGADSHYHVAGTAELMGAEVSLEGKIASDSFSLQGEAAIDMQGLAASVTFMVDQNGIKFVATAGGGAINAIKDNATKGIRTVADAAQQAIDAAQSAVDAAEREVDKLEAELEDARTEAQKEVDEVKAKIAKAKTVVDKARSSRNYWYNQRRSRYNSWRSSVAATRRAKWYQKAYYKSVEVRRYSSYAYAAGRYSAQVVAYNAANVAYNTVRNTAGWVLDNAGVEANPNVLRLKGLLAVANLAVDAADLVLNAAENANSGVLKTLAAIDSVKVTRITIAGDVSKYMNAGVNVKIDINVGGERRSLTLDASTEDLTQQLGKKLLSAII